MIDPRRTPLFVLLVAASVALTAAACVQLGCGGPQDTSTTNARDELVPFRSRAQLRDYLVAVGRARRPVKHAVPATAETTAAPAAEPPPAADGEESEADGEAGQESITSTQEAGVDEGGIVKAHGDHLIVLRRGRLFSIRLAAGPAAPSSVVDVSPPGSSKQTWYDEMLVSDDTIVVIGYSYDAGATELGLFDFNGRTGEIAHRSTHLLRSNDYYSSRNYASRLVGGKLVFYMPFGLSIRGWSAGDPSLELPGVRQFDSDPREWDTIIDAAKIFQPIQKTDVPILHTVVTCELGGRRDLSCTATGVIGPYGRTFYVSEKAVYVWVGPGHSPGPARQRLSEASSVVYRLPLDGGEPGALRVWGAPVDQFSFKEDADGHLNVLVRAESGGDWMWSPEAAGGDTALLRARVASFSTRAGTVPRSAYTGLPTPRAGWPMQNRFVGDHLLYGVGSSWDVPASDRDDRIYVHPYTRRGETRSLELAHGVSRIEVMGEGAVVIGTDGENLHFTSIDLGRPAIADRFVQTQAAQGELRSHGFFYKPMGEDRGVLGLPVRSAGSAGHEHLTHGSASVLFLAVDHLRFSRLGGLEARPETADDRCVVSCVDWYGNARPIFYRGRVFALLGYELVEGRIEQGGLREIGRTHFLRLPRAHIAR